ncbi:hypothetical protein IFR05_007797 [Cadophora sp. M221]|nr:hypothetical protein IFR05_007797 [Cadophora sp. M221]
MVVDRASGCKTKWSLACEEENIHRGNSSGLSSVPTSPVGTRRSLLSKPWESEIPGYEDDELQDTDIEEGAEDMEKQILDAMRKRTLSKGKEKAMMNKDKPTRLNNSTVPLPRLLPNGIQSSIDRLRAIRGESPGKRPRKSETPPRDAQDSDLEMDLEMELEKALQADLDSSSSGDESAEEPEVEEYGSFMEESASGRSTKDHVRTPGAASSLTSAGEAALAALQESIRLETIKKQMHTTKYIKNDPAHGMHSLRGM